MLFTFRLFIGWRGDSCSQTNVGKELLRNFSFWALGPRTKLSGERGQIIASQRHFPDFYTKQVLNVWRSPLHAVFHWNVKGKTRKKWKNTVSFVASLGAGVQPRSTVQLVMPVSDVEKRPSSQFFLGFGVLFGEEKPLMTNNVSF